MAYRPPINLKPLRQLINPRAYARGAASEYNPQINALTRQMAQSQRDNAGTIHDIQDWYGQLVGQNAGAMAQQQQLQQGVQQGGDAFRQNLIASLGQGVAPILAQDASQSHDFLANLGLNQQNLLASQGNAAAMQGVETAVRQNRGYDAYRKDLLGQLTDQQSAKAGAYAKAFQEGIGVRRDQAKDYIDAQMTSALAGPELEAAQLANRSTRLSQQGTKQQLQQQKELWPGQLEAQKLANKSAKWELDHAKDPNTGQTYGWNKLQPSDMLGIQKSLQQVVLGPEGGLKGGPIQAYNAMGNQLRAMSQGKWNPAVDAKVDRFRNTILGQYLPAWNKAHPGQQFVFKNGKLVPKSQSSNSFNHR